MVLVIIFVLVTFASFEAYEEVIKLEINADKAMMELRMHVAAIKELVAGLEFLKKYGDTNIEIPNLQSLFANGNEKEVNTESKDSVTIWPDTFHAMEAPVAAEKYLKVVGHAVPFEEIYDALLKGGFDAERDKNKINKSLTRATFRFKKFGSGMDASFGLLEWYPKRIRTAPIKTNEEKTEEEENVTETDKEKGE